MKTPRRSRRTALVLAGSIEALVAVLAFNATAFAAAITWDNGGLDQLWSNALNWNPDSAASGNDVTFGATGVAAAGTVTNIVDSSVTTNSLTFTNTGGAASAHTTQINPSQTLTVNGAAGFVLNSTGSLSSNVVITGSTGAFTVNGGSTAAFSVGVVTSAAAATQTLDMSGLGTFTANVGTFGLGTGARQAGVVKLASTNAITATTISVGTNTGTAGPASSLTLGLTNVINADTFNVGNGRDSGTISFATGLTGATVTIANRAGTGAANLTAGDLTAC